MRCVTMVIISVVNTVHTAFAGDIHVPTDYGTIQEAIDVAAAGDSILVDPGTYVEDLVIPGDRPMSLIAQSGGNVILEGGPNTSRVVFETGTAATTSFVGFVIRGGGRSFREAVMRMDPGASPEIRDNKILGFENPSNDSPPIVQLGTGSSPTIVGNVFESIRTTHVIEGRGAQGACIRDNRFLSIIGAYQVLLADISGTTVIEGNEVVAGESFGSIYIWGVGSTIVRNNQLDLRDESRGIRIDGREVLIENNVVRNATSDGIDVTAGSRTPIPGHFLEIRGNVVEGSDGEGIRVRGRAVIEDNVVRSNGIKSSYFSRGIRTGESSGFHFEPVVIRNNIIVGNGGGIRHFGNTVEIRDNLIEDNLHIGIDLNSENEPIIEGNVLRNNSHRRSLAHDGTGGALRIEYSRGVQIKDNILEGNLAESSGGAISLYRSRASVTGNTFTDNRAMDGEGGALFALRSEASLLGNTFSENSAVDGGAIATDFAGRLKVRECGFHGNRSDRLGGALAVRRLRSTVDFRKNVVVDNQAGDSAGALYIHGANIWARDCTFAFNTTLVPSRPQVVFEDAPNSELLGCIVWGLDGSGPAMEAIGGTPTVAYSNIQGGWPGIGNLDLDPRFRDPANEDYTLEADSPCVDAGNPQATELLDAMGNLRALDGRLDGDCRSDMGALEFNHVRIALSGEREPGKVVQLDVTGTSSLPAFLILGLAPKKTEFSPYGSLLVDLARTSLLLPTTVPATLHQKIPLDYPQGIPVYIQAIAYNAGTGNLSNLATLVLE